MPEVMRPKTILKVSKSKIGNFWVYHTAWPHTCTLPHHSMPCWSTLWVSSQSSTCWCRVTVFRMFLRVSHNSGFHCFFSYSSNYLGVPSKVFKGGACASLLCVVPGKMIVCTYWRNLCKQKHTVHTVFDFSRAFFVGTYWGWTQMTACTRPTANLGTDLTWTTACDRPELYTNDNVL